MATEVFKGAAGRQIIVQPSKLNAGSVLVQILSKSGGDSLCIELTAHSANMLANALEIEAVNGHALELKQSLEVA